MKAQLVLTSLALMTLTSACTLRLGDDKHTVKGPLKPSDIKITCAQNERCPSSQGILFGFTQKTNGDLITTTIERCTASLYAADKVITAGHCQMEDSQTVFFLPVPKPGLPSQLVPAHWIGGQYVKAVHDYGAFQLDTPLAGRELVHPAATVGPDFSHLEAFVVNESVGENYILEAKACRNIPNEVSSVTVDQNPYDFVVQDCLTIKGNSGGIFTPANRWNEVLGLISAGRAEPDSADERASMLKTYGLLHWTYAINVRCFSLPGWPQMESHCH